MNDKGTRKVTIEIGEILDKQIKKYKTYQETTKSEAIRQLIRKGLKVFEEEIKQ